MHKVIKAYTLEFSVQEGTINPKYRPDYQDCYTHTEEAFQDDLWRKMMATGHCGEWESCDYDDLTITVHVDCDKDIDVVIAELLEATMSDPDIEAVKDGVRAKMMAKVRDIIWDEDEQTKRRERIYSEDVTLFHSEDVDEN